VIGGHGQAGELVPDDELVDLIYAALLGEASWQRFLDRLAASAPSGKTLLVMHDNNRNDGYIPIASGIPKDVLGRYNGYFAGVNPFMKPASLAPVGVGLIDEALVPRSDLFKSEFFNDLLKPHEMPSRVALTVERDAGFQFILASLGTDYDDDCKLRIAEQMTRLHPHLRRAAIYYRRGTDEKVSTELGNSLFDALDIGVVVVGDRSQVKAISRTAEVIVRQSSVLRVSKIGSVSLRDEAVQALLSDMLVRTYSGPKVAHAAINNVQLSFIRIQRDRISTFFNGPTVVILLNVAAGHKSAVSDGVIAKYGLSVAERRVALGLISGRPIDRIAAEGNVSQATVRHQLKSIYAKTGTHRQVELAHLLWFGTRPEAEK
jgi:DNA-binding CsgD family transcriptional regulator